jgi:hypothetical protein
MPPTNEPKPPRRVANGSLIAGGLAVAGLAVGLLVALRPDPPAPASTTRGAPSQEVHTSVSAPVALERETTTAAARVQAPDPAAEPRPWESRSGEDPGPGYIPAWRLNIAPPEQVPPPTVNADRPDPAKYRPSMDNPGGVNGDRPERAMPPIPEVIDPAPPTPSDVPAPSPRELRAGALGGAGSPYGDGAGSPTGDVGTATGHARSSAVGHGRGSVTGR